MKIRPETETGLLRKWHLRLLIIAGLVTPTVTATGAYWGVKLTAQADKADMVQRISKLELDSSKTFVDKESFRNLDERTRRMEDSLTEIKTILKSKKP